MYHDLTRFYSQLSAATLAALANFNTEKAAHSSAFESLKANAESDFDNASTQQVSMDMFAEDWNVSQFWYTDATALTLAKQLLEGTDENSVVAVVSAPSVFVQVRNLIVSKLFVFVVPLSLFFGVLLSIRTYIRCHHRPETFTRLTQHTGIRRPSYKAEDLPLGIRSTL